MSKVTKPGEELSLLNQVREALKPLGAEKGPVLVAVSGGPDSTALLLALVEICGVERVQAAHLNHQLRGEESEADELFVRSLCGKLGAALHVARRDIASIARQTRDNLENAARRQRYAWLAEVARQWKLPWVATGHTANDQAETVLFRLLRGCGLRGMRGIAAHRPLTEGVQLIRPLLSVTRQEVNFFLQARGVTPRLDTSNLDLRRTRNRIRCQLLPLLQHEYNPHVVEHLSALAGQVDEWYSWIEKQARALLQDMELPRWDEGVVLEVAKVQQADPVLLRQILQILWEREGWPSGKMTARHWHRLADFLQSDGTSLELPQGTKVRRRLHTWVLSRRVDRQYRQPDS